MTPTEKDYVPFYVPSIGAAEIAEVTDALSSGWVGTGPKTHDFESAFAERIGAEDALALNSCTAALHLALVCAGIGEGDEVITTPMTFAATANVIEHVDATPVLVDVEPDTLNLDPDRVEDAVTSRTRAIVPVHYAGHPVELGALREIASVRDLLLVEDAAHALGARYGGRPVGEGHTVAAFSFYATKNITTAEGGMLTGPGDFLDRARTHSLHGMDRSAWNRYSRAGSWFYEITTPGFKYNMTDIQAAMGLRQLERLDGFQERRKEIFRRYSSAFAELDELRCPLVRDGVTHAYHLYVLRLEHERLAIGRNDFIQELDERGVGCSVHFIPVHIHPYYRDTYGYEPSDYPVAMDAYERMVSLPLYPGMDDGQVERVVQAVTDTVRENRR